MRRRLTLFNSLIWRLTASLTILSLTIGTFFAALVYVSLVNSLSRETDGYLEDTVNKILTFMKKEEGAQERLRNEISEELASRIYLRTYARLLNKNGEVIVETRGFPKKLVPALFPPATAWTSDVRGTDVAIVPRGRIYRTLSVKLDSPQASVLLIASDRRREEGIIKRFKNVLWATLVGSMFLSAAGVYWISRRGIRPVLQIARATEQIGQTTLHERIETSGQPEELRLLSNSFNAMLDRLEESFGRLSQFSEDIAHELRTPVNNLRGGMEVILGKQRTPEEYRDALGSALEECERLARLVDRLLFIARAENSVAKIERETVNVRDELHSTSEFYGATAEDTGVQILIDSPADLRISANRDLLRSLLGNLVSNAIAHTPSGGSVSLVAQRDQEGTILSIVDTGKGIPVDHLPHIFDRFYRVDRSRAKTSGGVGLGLAIVHTIAKLHGAGLVVVSVVDKGTTISVKFPDEVSV